MTRLLPLVLLAIAIPGCGDDPATSPDAGTADAAPDAALPTYTARIRGPLADPDLAAARAYHDGVAMNGEAGAHQLGDFAHQVVLGTTDLGTTQDQFVAIDQWRSAEGASTLYNDPDFQAALGPLFAAPPEVELYERHTDWYGWGDLGAGRATGQPYWLATIHGRLKQATVAENQAAHDAIAAGAEDQAHLAGDIAHVPHLGLTDDREFFNIDLWTDEAGMLAVYTDPAFQQAFLSLFESPPELYIYRSTDWYQWYQP